MGRGSRVKRHGRGYVCVCLYLSSANRLWPPGRVTTTTTTTTSGSQTRAPYDIFIFVQYLENDDGVGGGAVMYAFQRDAKLLTLFNNTVKIPNTY